MRLFLILPALFLLACSSAPADSPDPDQYLARVRQMHAENRAQFEHLTGVTFAPPVAQSSSDPNEPNSTYDEWKLYVLSGLLPQLIDLSKTSTFLWAQLNELNTMAVPEEHTDLHADLITMWEAGIASVDQRLRSAQQVATYVQTDDWEAFGAFDDAYNEELARWNALSERHINAVSRAEFVLFGTPEPEPFDISGSSTAWALTPFPDEPTATLGQISQPTPTAAYEESIRRYADDACVPEKLDYPTIGWPKLAAELSWAISLLRYDPPRGLGGFRDVLWDYYETLQIFAEEQDRSLKVDQALFSSDPDVLQKRMEVEKTLNALPESDRQVLNDAGCAFS